MKFFKNKKNLLVYVILAAAAAGLYFKYFKKEDTITYITQPVRRQNVEKVVNATGEVKAVDLVTVGAQVSGKIEKLYVSIGQTVKMGDMIAEIDSTTQQNDVDIAFFYFRVRQAHDGQGGHSRRNVHLNRYFKAVYAPQGAAADVG